MHFDVAKHLYTTNKHNFLGAFKKIKSVNFVLFFNKILYVLDIYDIIKNKNGGDNYASSGNEST